jgi:hypothetical protein
MDLIQYLNSYKEHMNAFIQRFPSEIHHTLLEASSDVLGRLSLYRDEEIHCLLDSYQFYRKELGSISPGVNGWFDLWKILTLIQIARPDWDIKNVPYYSNFGINKSYYYILYSLNQDTMSEIVMELAERFFESPMAFFADRMFSRLLILENTLLLSEDENLCFNCSKEFKEVHFDRIVTNYGKTEVYDRWGISKQQIGEVRIVCFKCLQSIVLKSNTFTLAEQLQEVI